MAAPRTNQMYLIRGMDCAACAKTVEQGVAQLPGVETCTLTFPTAKLSVSGPVAREAIFERVEALGYGIGDVEEAGPQQKAATPNFGRFLWGRWETRLALLGALLILPGLIVTEIGRREYLLIDLSSALALIVAGGPIVRSAWRALRVNRTITINLLMTIASVGALAIGAYTEAGMVMVLFALGEALEGYTAAKARDAIQGLASLAPATALRLAQHGDHQHEEEVPVAELAIGDLIVVKPGASIPMDGRVARGASSVNQAAITGESRLIEKGPGAELFAGSINGEGSLEVEVTRLAADTTISRMIALVEEAQERRAPAQRFVDTFASRYTPAVIVLAALVAVVPPLVSGQPFLDTSDPTRGWLYRALALLVVACPCALVISVPVSVISALSNAARRGVLIKGGAYLEQLAKVRAVAFDKTGTLTAGAPAVVGLRSVDCTNATGTISGDCAACEEMLALAHAVERRSEHPLAKAIVAAGSARGIDRRYPAADEERAQTGRGVTGLVAGRTVTIGSHASFETTIPHPAEHCQAARDDADEGRTPVLLSADGAYRGTITVADAVRDSSRDVIAELKGLGLGAVAMLTGDNAGTARRIGADLGVTDIRAELLPEQKVAAVEALQREHGPLAMVGDGINDTPALATASVGIAIGGAGGGTAQAMETADITLLGGDLRQLPFLFRLSRATMRTIQANVVASLGAKAVVLALIVAGLGTMWMAVLADVGIALLVTLNGMRLLRRPE
ncbi:MAG: heavy metal translocating P-type ATPase [Thermomicrobiales bacterium]